MKPIRVFWSPLTERFFATRSYRDGPDGRGICTGAKYDVTQDIASAIVENGITFKAERRGKARGK